MTTTELEYAIMVNRLFRSPDEIRASLTDAKINIWHAASGIAGEAGEVLDEVKKICAYGRDVDAAAVEKLIKELGDLEFYMEGLRQALGITRCEVLRANIDKLALRYPDAKFSQEAANARVDVK